MLKLLSSILCDLDPKVKAIGQKAGICDGVPSTSALVLFLFSLCKYIYLYPCHAEYFIYYTPHQIFEAFLIQASIVKNSVDPEQIGFIRSQLIWI